MEATTEQNLSEYSESEKTQGMLCHLLTFSGWILPIPFVNFIAPIFIWTLGRDKSNFIDECGKESINFQITTFIIGLAIIPLMILLMILTIVLVIIEEKLIILVAALFALLILAFIAISIAFAVFIIIASIKTKQGHIYRYPINFRFIK